MKTGIANEFKEVMEAVHYRPAVSIIIPFEPKMRPKNELQNSLNAAADKVELELLENYPEEISRLIMQKIHNIIKGINYITHKKSIAIYVSPVFEKVLYLSMAVEEKVIVDESFEIRDLVYCKKQLRKYLVLSVSSNQSQLYLGNGSTLDRIVSDTIHSTQVIQNNIAERVANFSSIAERKEILLDKFMHHIDDSLGIILNAYQLPLFIIGSDKILGHFNKITKHSKAIIEYIHGNYEEVAPEKLKKIMAPYINNWKKVIQKNLLNQLKEAASEKKLAFGMRDVWRDAMSGKGRLLLIEKDFMYAAEHGSTDEVIYKAIEPYNKFSCIKDAVDDVIEKVLEDGGDVEFTDKEVLHEYQHIALIKHY